MKKYSAVVLLLVAMGCLAKTREWKAAQVTDLSTTDVNQALGGAVQILRYTVETDEMIYVLEYNCKYDSKCAAGVTTKGATKIAIEGNDAYLQNKNGKGVKMRIVSQAKK